MIEFMIGLVIVLVVSAALIQFIRLTTADTRVLNDARAEAGETALALGTALFAPEFIRDWEEGADGKRHTRDDRVSSQASAGSFNDTIVDRAAADPAGWSILGQVPVNTLPSLYGDPMPVTRFGLVKGEASENVDLISAVQSLLYRADSVDLESTVWMTATRGIY